MAAIACCSSRKRPRASSSRSGVSITLRATLRWIGEDWFGKIDGCHAAAPQHPQDSVGTDGLGRGCTKCPRRLRGKRGGQRSYWARPCESLLRSCPRNSPRQSFRSNSRLATDRHAEKRVRNYGLFVGASKDWGAFALRSQRDRSYATCWFSTALRTST